MLLDKLKIEFICVFFIYFLTAMTSSSINTSLATPISLASLSFLAYCLMTWLAEPISGAHFNPVITLSQILTKHIKPEQGSLYITFQILACILAASLTNISLPEEVLYYNK